MSDESDYQDYLDYHKYLASHKIQQVPQNIPGDLAKQMNPVQRKVVGGITSGGVGELMAPMGQALSNVASKGVGSLSDFMKPAVDRANAVDLVKDEANLGPAVSDKISQATEQFNKSQISPRMQEQYSRADQQTIPFNASEYKGIHPKIDEMVDRVSSGGVKEIPMKDALELRASLNDKSLFKDMGPYSEEIAARSQKALGVGNQLRSSINQIDPNIDAISGELQDAYKLRNAVTQSAGKRPISTVTAPIGSDKGSLLSQFDQSAGTDLRGLGQDVDTARERLGGAVSSMPLSKAGVIKRSLGVIPRMADATAQSIQPAVRKLSDLLATPTAGAATGVGLQSLIQGRDKE